MGEETMRIGVLILTATLLASCSSSPTPSPDAAPPVAVAPITPIAPPQPVEPELKPVNSDTCGVRDLQYLVGRPRTEIPVPVDPSKRRVLCSTCAATMDYRADRQTIVFDTQSGIIKTVSCG